MELGGKGGRWRESRLAAALDTAVRQAGDGLRCPVPAS